ncbi:MAG: DUF6968 family protein [Geminicoccaceae bacterium]
MPKPIIVEEIIEPIARRSLLLGKDIVLVTIGKPRSFDPNELEGNYCPYSIDFRGRRKWRYAGGVDVVQALQLVMDVISSDLEAIGMKNEGVITWEGLPKGTGFPRSS